MKTLNLIKPKKKKLITIYIKAIKNRYLQVNQYPISHFIRTLKTTLYR